jgi:hypothetical protein
VEGQIYLVLRRCRERDFVIAVVGEDRKESVDRLIMQARRLDCEKDCWRKG